MPKQASSLISFAFRGTLRPCFDVEQFVCRVPPLNSTDAVSVSVVPTFRAAAFPALEAPRVPITRAPHRLTSVFASFFLASLGVFFSTMNVSKFYGPLLLVVCCLSLSHALECYVCTNQEGNREKCLKSTKTCEQGQDTCLTEIRWGSTPYWSQGAKKQSYVSKKCATKKECERIKQSNMEDCTYIWYQDWKCSDCCQGDKCNYYIISSAKKVRACWVIVIAALVSLQSLWSRMD